MMTGMPKQPAKQVTVWLQPPPDVPVVETKVEKHDAGDYVSASMAFNIPIPAENALIAHGAHLLAEQRPWGRLLDLENGQPDPREGHCSERDAYVDGTCWPSYVQIACTDLGADAPNRLEVTRVELEYRIMTDGGALESADPDRAMAAAKRNLEVEERKLASAVMNFAPLSVEAPQGDGHDVS
jgi:hypothetical protein